MSEIIRLQDADATGDFLLCEEINEKAYITLRIEEHDFNGSIFLSKEKARELGEFLIKLSQE